MIQAIKNFINDIRKEHERDVYYAQCWTNGLWVSNSICYKIIFDHQQVMIDNGMLETHGRGRFDNSDEFENWLEENLRGYYNVRGWGNGRGNPNQIENGIWHLEVHCMREEDALAVKMRWEW
ncbi:hypothetical protein LCGC14_1062400 [marine sediment metagenome]|uniref:Uncharacterized protein n=1 Tax=marine sediment metagenome TaxID=412755 RepID=A0A0F9MKS0_9ZZZZ